MSSNPNAARTNRPLQVGDICITVNSDHPACNDGDLVTIVMIDHTRHDVHEGFVPYLVRRIDGLPHISTVDWGTGTQRWAKCIDAWCAEHKLQRVEPDFLNLDNMSEAAEQISLEKI
jgi:hypothetical protein